MILNFLVKNYYITNHGENTKIFNITKKKEFLEDY